MYYTAMYLLDLETNRIFAVTAFRTQTEYRVLNCNMLFELTQLDPNEFDLTLPPEWIAYGELNAPNSSWYLCPTAEDALRLTGQNLPEIHYLYLDTPDGTSVIPVRAEWNDDEHVYIINQQLLNCVVKDDFIASTSDFYPVVKPDQCGNPYHPLRCGPPHEEWDCRLYDSLSDAETAAEQTRVLRRLHERVRAIDNVDIDTLKTIISMLDNAKQTQEERDG